MLNGKRSYIIPPPELRSSSPLSQGDIEMEIGKRKVGKLGSWTFNVYMVSVFRFNDDCLGFDATTAEKRTETDCKNCIGENT